MEATHPARADPARQAYWLLRLGFTVAPLLAGIDKFFNVFADWDRYLAPWLDRAIPGSAEQFMWFVGGVEMMAGVVVAFAPRIGGWMVAVWLGGIVTNLLTHTPPLYYDIALRDFGLMIGAVTLARLAVRYEDMPAARHERDETAFELRRAS